jgi:molecular chaperone Hsp33
VRRSHGHAADLWQQPERRVAKRWKTVYAPPKFRLPAAAALRSRLMSTVIDDIVLPFHLQASRMSGRLLRLGPAVDHILTRHTLAEPVSHALGEAIGLTALFSTGLKVDSRFTDGRFIMQTKSNGPLGFLVVHYDWPGNLRGHARVTQSRAGEIPAKGRGDQSALLGEGHLAMTILPGGDLETYQGIVPLGGVSLTDATHTYFRQSEQLPTFIRMAVARHYAAGQWHWRVGGLMLQYVPKAGGDARPLTPAEADARDASLYGEDDEDWRRARLLAETVEDHELLDPLLSPERLLYRLFHEEGVAVSSAVPLAAKCTCSRERIAAFLDSFARSELADMTTPDGKIEVTCEFCSTAYRFEPADVGRS